MLWNSWAKSWGTAWAESWGPLEEQEQAQVPHGGGDSSAARLAREAVEKARRKAVQKQIERDLQIAQEALDGIRDAAREGAREALESAKALDKLDAVPEAYLPLPDVPRIEVSPLAPVNDLVSRVVAVSESQPTLLIAGEIQTNDDDEALALIMILAEMD